MSKRQIRQEEKGLLLQPIPKDNSPMRICQH